MLPMWIFLQLYGAGVRDKQNGTRQLARETRRQKNALPDGRTTVRLKNIYPVLTSAQGDLGVVFYVSRLLNA